MSNKPKVLVIEDELPQQLIVNKALHLDFQTKFISTFKQALEWIQSHERPDCILMDVMLDESDGFELCALMKAHPHLREVPFIFLSSKSEVSSKVLGLSLGADDYIVKPCDPLELRARIQTRIASKHSHPTSGSKEIFGPIHFDLHRQVIALVQGSEDTPAVEVQLTPLEFKMFLYLAKKNGKPASRNELLEQVWGSNHHVIPRTVDTFVAGLRKKLGEYKQLVKSVHGVGYKFESPDPNPKAA